MGNSVMFFFRESLVTETRMWKNRVFHTHMFYYDMMSIACFC
jgi:hypothetical protein